MKVTKDPVYICDRCGQEIGGDDPIDGLLPMVLIRGEHTPIVMTNNYNQSHVDLCAHCKKLFVQWFEAST